MKTRTVPNAVGELSNYRRALAENTLNPVQCVRVFGSTKWQSYLSVTHLGVRNPSEVLIDTRRKSSRPDRDKRLEFRNVNAPRRRWSTWPGQCHRGSETARIGVRKYRSDDP